MITRCQTITMARGFGATRPPVATWVLMALSLAAALFLLDWTGTGVTKPLIFFALPGAMGLVGTGLAVVDREWMWAVISGVWGVLLVPVLLVTITLTSGP